MKMKYKNKNSKIQVWNKQKKTQNRGKKVYSKVLTCTAAEIMTGDVAGLGGSDFLW